MCQGREAKYLFKNLKICNRSKIDWFSSVIVRLTEFNVNSVYKAGSVSPSPPREPGVRSVILLGPKVRC